MFTPEARIPEYDATVDENHLSNPPDKKKPWAPGELDALHKKNDQEANWLLYGYQEAQRLNSPSPQTEDDKNNPYAQIAADKDLAKLAGLPAHDSTKSTTTPDLHADATNPGKNSLTLREDPSLKSNGRDKPNLHNEKYKSFITPLSNFLNFGSHSSSDNNFIPLSPDADSKKITPYSDPDKKTVNEDDFTMDTPGMTAAINNPTLDNRLNWNSSMDMLPGESFDHAKTHQDFYMAGELPSGSSTLQLQDVQKKSLRAPQALGVSEPITISPLLLNPPTAPPAISKPGPISTTPVRPRIADPHDFLNR